MNTRVALSQRYRAMAVASVVLASVWLVNWPRFPLYNALVILALSALFLAFSLRLERVYRANVAVLLPLLAVYFFYVLPLIKAPSESSIGVALPEWLEGWEYVEATLLGSLVIAGFTYAFTRGAIASGAKCILMIAGPSATVASACGLVGAGGMALAATGAWMLREYFSAIFASTETVNVRWVLHEGEAGFGRWRMLADFAGPSGVLIGVFAATKRLPVAMCLIGLASLLSVAVVAPFLGRLVLVFAAMGPLIGYLYAKRRGIWLGTLILLLFAGLPVIFAYTALFRGFEATTGEALFERIMYSDIGRVYAAFYLPYASSFEPDVSYAVVDLTQFQVALLGSSVSSGGMTSTEAFSTLVTGYPSSHVVPGFLGSFFMTFGVVWGSAAAIAAGFLVGKLIGWSTTKQGGVWEICGLLLSVFVTRNWIPHSNSSLAPLLYVYTPLVIGVACLAQLRTIRRPV